MTVAPKADLHLHQEQTMRLDRVLARREGRAPYDWAAWRRRLASLPPGAARLAELSSVLPVPVSADDDDALFVERVADLLEEAAADGAVLVEVRFGNDTVLREGFMELFRRAEARVRATYPSLRAEAVVTVLALGFLPPARVEEIAAGTIRAAAEGVTGVDLLYRPYDVEVDWAPLHRLAARFAEAGLGITAHAGELTPANLAVAAETPGLTRLGHAVHADDRLLERLAHRGIAIEACLTCNVALGAVPSLEEHPLRRFRAAGVTVVLGTDDPVQLGTTIAGEYAAAAALGLDDAALRGLTRDAVRVAFTTPERRAALLAGLA